MTTSRVVRKRADSVEKIEGLEVLVKEASALLPAWFVPRMMNDEWMFGLLLVTGHWLPMERIERVFKDCTAEIWMDVEALPRFKSEGFQGQEMSFVQVAEARTKVSVSVRQGGASDGTGGGVKNELSSVGAGWWESVSRSLFDGMQARFVVGADRDASDSGCAGEEPLCGRPNGPRRASHGLKLRGRRAEHYQGSGNGNG